MVHILALWLPILLSAVLVFLASSVIHMLTPWHRSDYAKLPDEDKFRDAVRPLGIAPGDYMVPRPSSTAEMRSQEFKEKFAKGPVMVFTMMQNKTMGMGKNLVLWFLYAIVVGIFSAYIAGRALPPGAQYLQVFRFAGAAAFLTYAGALWPMSIWYQRSWSLTFKATVDGLIYALLTAGVFGWLWPR